MPRADITAIAALSETPPAALVAAIADHDSRIGTVLDLGAAWHEEGRSALEYIPIADLADAASSVVPAFEYYLALYVRFSA